MNSDIKSDINSEFFSKSKPVLINNKVLKDINKALDVPYVEPRGKFNSLCSRIYHNYICPNMFPLILILLIIIFLFVRYMLKKNKINKRIIKREKFINLNPSVPVSRQTNYANYIPDQTEVIRMNNKEYTYNDLYKSPHLPDDITPDDYINDEYSIDDKLNSTSDIDSRWEVKSGLNNTWKNESDSNIFNIYKTPNDYVKTTSQAVDYAVDKNRKNLDDLSREMY